MRQRGFTLVECAVAFAATAVLAAVAVPAWQGQELRAARLDAVNALTRVQLAQESHRAHHGWYAGELQALRGTGAASDEGRYVVSIERGADLQHYRATATATGAQARDGGCRTITLDVTSGFPTFGPAPACWLR